jgi:hypothetical protein
VLCCAAGGDSFRYTFVDHDGSVQEAAAVAPWGVALPDTGVGVAAVGAGPVDVRNASVLDFSPGYWLCCYG